VTTIRHDVTPNPERIAESLRDTGYTLNTAVADVVDNSIAAQATKVAVELELDLKGNIRFSVSDNGIGMTEDGLINALKYGSNRRDDPSSLGKFGLGLKTASTSFARRLIVTSRAKSGDGAVAAAWDLDEVGLHGWSVGVESNPDPVDLRVLDGVTGNGTGTVVRWQKIDRIMRQYDQPTGPAARKAIDKISGSLSEHLSMIFQRFLDPEDDRASTVSLTLNGSPVVSWNPFGFGAKQLYSRAFEVRIGETATSIMNVKAYVLPRKAELQAAFGSDAPERARLTNRNQGIYVYRENRLIHGPDWLGMWVQEPHLALSRVELSFTHELDDAFQVDIKKSRINLDVNIAQALSTDLSSPRAEAQRVMRESRRDVTAALAAPSIHAISNAAIQDASASIPTASLTSVDAGKGSATISNSHGTVSVKYIEHAGPQVFVEAVDSLQDGVFYEPAYIGENPGVRINKSHAFYEKVYLPNRESGTTIQALDSLLWALANAEFSSTTGPMKDTFEDIRIDVSKALRRLVEDLPDPKEFD
jgi:hypothetical protein